MRGCRGELLEAFVDVYGQQLIRQVLDANRRAGRQRRDRRGPPGSRGLLDGAT